MGRFHVAGFVAKEAKFRLPQKVWRELIDSYYPNTAWLCLRRDVFDRLNQYKMRRGIPTGSRPSSPC